jgi:RNA polymerase sigma-70 factor (ECF subfamily)
LPERLNEDERLLLAAARGDLEAFAELVDRHQAWAWRIAYRFFGEYQNAEDVVQEAFLKLLQAAPRYSPRAAFRTYFCANPKRKFRSEEGVFPLWRV